MSTNQPRRPAGTPSGGQWSPATHAEVDISLVAKRCGSPTTSRSARPGLVHLTPAAKQVIGACTRAGGRPLIVGGSVRDALLGDHEPKDIDIEVYGVSDKERFFSAVAGAGEWSDLVGRSFGVVKVYLDGESFDVSLPRRDSKVGDGHRGFVVETADLTEAEAACRRDFTVNTIGWDPVTGELVDCWGGAADIEAGVLRATSQAFSEDPLRVLRGMQFTARFGWRMDEATVETCASLRGAYNQLAVERVAEEWRKALTKGRHFPEMLSELKRTGWLAHYPELAVLDGLEQEPYWHPEGDVFTHSGLAAQAAADAADEAGLVGDDRYVVVAAALLHDVGKATTTKRQVDAAGVERIVSHGHAEAGTAPAGSFLASIGCPEHLRRRVTPLVAEHMAAVAHQGGTGAPTQRAVRRLARRLAPATVTEWALVVRADRLGRGGNTKRVEDVESWAELAREVGVEEAPAQRLLRGDHLIAAGWAPCPRFRVVLEAAEQAQDDGEFKDEAGAVEWFSEHYGTERVVAGRAVEALPSPSSSRGMFGSDRRPRG